MLGHRKRILASLGERKPIERQNSQVKACTNVYCISNVYFFSIAGHFKLLLEVIKFLGFVFPACFHLVATNNLFFKETYLNLIIINFMSVLKNATKDFMVSKSNALTL